MSSYLLSIGIVSYNRPVELCRAINSLLPLPEFVEVIICDDKSPKIVEILSSINSFISLHSIRFIQNENNLGYDKNLYNVIKLSNSNHVLLLGDDDYLEPGVLKNVLNFIKNTADFHSGFIRFSDKNGSHFHRSYKITQYFKSETLKLNGNFIFNSILFSGLIFSKSSVLMYQDLLPKYFNSIYIQVAIFSFINLKFGSYFIAGPGVITGGDGESGFGFNEAANSNDFDLKDRSSIISNISYHKRLFNVIKKVDYDYDLRIFKPFIIEYKIRSVKAVYEARKLGRRNLIDYVKELLKLEISGLYILFPIYFIIFLSPTFILNFPFKFIERIILKIRSN
jgi:abequosyltransferase